MRVRFTPTALSEVEQIYSYIAANEVVILNVRHGARRNPWEA